MYVVHAMFLRCLGYQILVVGPKLVKNGFLLLIGAAVPEARLKRTVTPCLCCGDHPFGVLPSREVGLSLDELLAIRTTNNLLVSRNQTQIRTLLNASHELLSSPVVIRKRHTKSLFFVDDTLFLELVPRGLEGIPHALPNVGLAQEVSLLGCAKVDANEPTALGQLLRSGLEDCIPILGGLDLLGFGGSIRTACRVHVFQTPKGGRRCAEPVHGREGDTEVDAAAGIALGVEAHSTGLDEDATHVVGGRLGGAIRILHLLEAQGMVEHTLPFIAELILVVDYHLLFGLSVADGPDDVGKQTERCAGIGGAKIGDVKCLVGADGLGRYLLQDGRRSGIDHIKASLGGGSVLSLSVRADWRVDIVELLGRGGSSTCGSGGAKCSRCSSPTGSCSAPRRRARGSQRQAVEDGSGGKESHLVWAKEKVASKIESAEEPRTCYYM